MEKKYTSEHGPQRGALSEHQARELAKGSRHYVARRNHYDEWYVWDSVSDHRVEFDCEPQTQRGALSKLNQFENYMSDVRTRSVAKRAALAAFWFIENVTPEDADASEVFFLVREYVRGIDG